MTVNLRTKLFLLLLVIFIVFFIIRAENIYESYNDSVNQEVESKIKHAEALSAGFSNYFNSLWSLCANIGDLALSEEIVGYGGIDRVLEAAKSFDRTIAGLSWIDPTGIVQAGTFSEALHLDVSDREYFQRILKGEEKVISDLIYGKITGAESIMVARGIYSAHKLIGVVSIIVHLKDLEMVFPIHDKSQTDNFGLVDRNGVIVYSNARNSSKAMTLRDDAPARTSLSGTVAVYKNYNGVLKSNRVGAAVPIPSIGWAVFSSSSSNDLFSDYLRQARFDIFILIFVMCCTLIGAAYLVNHILKPVRRIRYAACEISQGDLSVRTGLQGADELGQTGQVFDNMAERIQMLEVNRNRFLQSAAHELRNPMTGIKGIVSIIRRRAEVGKPMSEISPLFLTLEREVDRMANLLNHILDAFRSQKEFAASNLNQTKVKVSEVIKSALEPFTLAGLIHTFKYEYPDGQELYAMADSDRLEDVLRNLLSNAVKYSPDGGEIKVKLCKDDTNVVICVEDQGIGISEENLKGVFECFFRVNQNKHMDPGGMGLGLFLCKSIIEKKGGEIWVESQEGVGSKFFISLPLCRD